MPPRRLLALPIDDTTMSSWLPGCANAGSEAVTITAATFLSCMFLPAGSVMPSCESMLVRLCVVNGVCMVWSPVLSRPTTRP
ncbi:hypothetical protein D9M72_563350 [compost metagenome]